MSSGNNTLSLLFSGIVLSASLSAGILQADPVAVSGVNDLANLASSGGDVEVSLSGVLETWSPMEAYPMRSYRDGDNSMDYHVYKFTPSFKDGGESGSWLLYSKNIQEEGSKSVSGTLLANKAKPGTLGSGMTLFVADTVTPAQ